MRRRAFVLASAGAFLARSDETRRQSLAMEAYIFQQYAQKQGKPLKDVLPTVVPMAKMAGFKNIEFNREFFAPAIADVTLNLVHANDIRMPSVYLGGRMHEQEGAEETTREALRLSEVCRPFGCVAVVINADPKGKGAQKSKDELQLQAKLLNEAGRTLAKSGLQLRLHNHTPEMANGAREWRWMLRNTDPKYVSFCLDLDWVYQGGENPLGLLKEAGKRESEIHARNSKDKVWLESFAEGDVNYRQIADYLKSADIKPLIAVELAYQPRTVVTQSLGEDLHKSREYAERIFGLKA